MAEEVDGASSDVETLVQQYMAMVRSKDEAIVELMAQIAALQEALNAECETVQSLKNDNASLAREVSTLGKGLKLERSRSHEAQQQLSSALDCIAENHVSLLQALQYSGVVVQQSSSCSSRSEVLPSLDRVVKAVRGELQASHSQLQAAWKAAELRLMASESHSRDLIRDAYDDGLNFIVVLLETSARLMLQKAERRQGVAVALKAFAYDRRTVDDTLSIDDIDSWFLVAMNRHATNAARDLARHLAAAQYSVEISGQSADFFFRKLEDRRGSWNVDLLGVTRTLKECMLREELARVELRVLRDDFEYTNKRNRELADQCAKLSRLLSASRGALHRARSQSPNVSTRAIQHRKSSVNCSVLSEKVTEETLAREEVSRNLTAMSDQLTRISQRAAEIERCWRMAEDRVCALEEELERRCNTSARDAVEERDRSALEDCVSSVAETRSRVQRALME